MWDVRITRCGARIGVGYFSIPEAGGMVARIRRPRGDIEKISLPRSGTLEGFLVAALDATTSQHCDIPPVSDDHGIRAGKVSGLFGRFFRGWGE